jgi:hypothetical protein
MVKGEEAPAPMSVEAVGLPVEAQASVETQVIEQCESLAVNKCSSAF